MITHQSEVLTIKFEVELLHEDGYDDELDICCISVEPRGLASDGPCVCSLPEPGPDDDPNAPYPSNISKKMCSGCWFDYELDNIGAKYLLESIDIKPTKSCEITIKGYMASERYNSYFGDEYDSYFECTDGPEFQYPNDTETK